VKGKEKGGRGKVPSGIFSQKRKKCDGKVEEGKLRSLRTRKRREKGLRCGLAEKRGGEKG